MRVWPPKCPLFIMTPRSILPIFAVALSATASWAQQPVINPGGVVNAASYVTGIYLVSTQLYPPTGGGPALAAGSIAAIFGSNLAASIAVAPSVPLPFQLGGATVSVGGLPAALYYASPGQINFEIPAAIWESGNTALFSVVVSTAAGQSDPYSLSFVTTDTAGIFGAGAAGCGQGAVLNVAADGSVSLNSSAMSAAPGDFISIFGTGLGATYDPPPDGTATPVSPLTTLDVGGGVFVTFDFSTTGLYGAFEGRAPTLVGVDQINIQVPLRARQGCNVPLQLIGNNASPPVTISIASGGGACVDPPTQGYGQIIWISRSQRLLLPSRVLQ